MKTTLEQLEINGEVLDMTEYTTKEEMQSVAKESTLLQESAAIKDKIDNIDLSSIEEKIDNIKLPEIDTTELAKEATLHELLNRSAHYDSVTGNLTIENVQITIE